MGENSETRTHEHDFSHKKKPKWNYFSIILVALLIIAVGYIAFDKISNIQQKNLDDLRKKAYEEGMRNQTMFILNQVMYDLNTKGETAITLPTENGKTMTIPLIPLSTIISQLNQKGIFSFTTFDSTNKSVNVDLIIPSFCNQYNQMLALQTNQK